MSPRAACRLEQLGFSAVYDYVGGKTDWLAYDLPYEGERLLTSSVVQRDVPTARREERLADARDRFAAAPAGMLVVVADGMVNGVVRSEGVENADPETVLDHVMDVGVTTVRPAEDVEDLAHRMQHAGVHAITVTRSDGRLVGIFERTPAHAARHTHGAPHDSPAALMLLAVVTVVFAAIAPAVAPAIGA